MEDQAVFERESRGIGHNLIGIKHNWILRRTPYLVLLNAVAVRTSRTRVNSFAVKNGIDVIHNRSLPASICQSDDWSQSWMVRVRESARI